LGKNQPSGKPKVSAYSRAGWEWESRERLDTVAGLRDFAGGAPACVPEAFGLVGLEDREVRVPAISAFDVHLGAEIGQWLTDAGNGVAGLRQPPT